MSRSRHERLSDLFQAAVEMSPTEREDFLDRECAGDPELRRELEGLLDLDGGAAGLATATAADPTEQYPSDWRPEADAPRIAGYTIVRRIGSGGAGSVFEAHDEGMNRRVALKVLHGPAWLSAKASRRFEREAWITGKLNHPNIVRVYERGTSEGIDYYSMELVDGGSLHDVLGRMRRMRRDEQLGLQFGGRDYIAWAIRQVVLAARALDYAHRQGVVHRDVKPLNLLLGTEPAEVKVADFGIAMDEQSTRLTTEGQVLGTVRYMAPEQIRGKADEIDRRVDVHALGVTLFELLTLDYPYRGKTYERYMRSVLTEGARRPSRLNDRVGRDLEVVIGKSLEKDRRDRYETAGEFADDLENVLNFKPIRAQPPAAATRAVKWVRRKPIHAALIGVLILGAPTAGIMSYRMLQQGRLLQDVELQEMERQLNSLGLTFRYPEIVELASEILAIDARHPGALRSRALASLNLSFNDDAQYDADAWIAAEPEKAGPYRLKAHVLRRLERNEEAAASDRHADTLSSSDPNDVAFLDDLYFQGRLALDAGDYERVLELMDELLRARQRPDAIRARAVALARLRRYEAAIGEYRILAGIDPKNPTVYSDMGRVFMLWGKHDEADASLSRARELNADDPVVYERLADNALRWGNRFRAKGADGEALTQFKNAEMHARDGLLRDEFNPWLHLNLGQSLVERHRLEPGGDGSLLLEAQEHLGTARDLATTQALRETAAFNQCDVLIEARRLDQALAACEQVARDYPEDPVAHYNLAAVHALAGRVDEAFAALEEDLRLGDTEYGYLLGDANLESLREDTRFQDIVDRMKRNAAD